MHQPWTVQGIDSPPHPPLLERRQWTVVGLLLQSGCSLHSVHVPGGRIPQSEQHKEVLTQQRAACLLCGSIRWCRVLFCNSTPGPSCRDQIQPLSCVGPVSQCTALRRTLSLPSRYVGACGQHEPRPELAWSWNRIKNELQERDRDCSQCDCHSRRRLDTEQGKWGTELSLDSKKKYGRF